MIWLGLNWSLALYQEANGKLYRQGQMDPMIVHYLAAEGGADEDLLAGV